MDSLPLLLGISLLLALSLIIYLLLGKAQGPRIINSTSAPPPPFRNYRLGEQLTFCIDTEVMDHVSSVDAYGDSGGHKTSGSSRRTHAVLLWEPHTDKTDHPL